MVSQAALLARGAAGHDTLSCLQEGRMHHRQGWLTTRKVIRQARGLASGWAVSSRNRGSRNWLAELCSPSRPSPHPGFRLLLEENTSQALTEEPLFKRPRTTCDALSLGAGNFLCLPFPKKLRNIVNSNQFASIWWDDDGTCIGIDEKLFQKEFLERHGLNKVFETDCMKFHPPARWNPLWIQQNSSGCPPIHVPGQLLPRRPHAEQSKGG